MRRWLFVISILLTLVVSGCATGMDSRVTDLETKVAKMDKQLKTGMAAGSGANFYPARDFINNGAGCLDEIANPSDKDVGFVIRNDDTTYGNSVFIYTFDSGSSATEAVPWVITPNTGTGRWLLIISSNMVPTYATSGRAITAQECRGGFVEVSAAGTYTLPAAATVGFGTVVMIRVRDAEVGVIAPATGEKLNLTGVALAANATIQNSGVANDFIALIATTDSDQGSGTDGWICLGRGGTWAAT